MVGDLPSLTASAATTPCGVDHVRLLYRYLDTGEFDAYASLLDENVQVRGVSARPAHGREAAADAARATADPSARHELYKIIAAADSVVVTGRRLALDPDTGPTEFDFADVFTLSDDALVLSQRRFHYLAELTG
jgi:hypothetical protein